MKNKRSRARVLRGSATFLGVAPLTDTAQAPEEHVPISEINTESKIQAEQEEQRKRARAKRRTAWIRLYWMWRMSGMPETET
ncbi:MAG: hypothetical protein LBH06_07535 [Rikenellaceae bacterium]|jgi:hypothetical protein|nr:hypothetical protein [Rikenellaceae bacterium]